MTKFERRIRRTKKEG